MHMEVSSLYLDVHGNVTNENGSPLEVHGYTRKLLRKKTDASRLYTAVHGNAFADELGSLTAVLGRPWKRHKWKRKPHGGLLLSAEMLSRMNTEASRLYTDVHGNRHG